MYTGPNIQTQGLVLALDAGNTKSFRGEPTTNLITNGNFENGKIGWNLNGNSNALTTTGIYYGKSSIYVNGLQWYNEIGYFTSIVNVNIGATYTISFEYYLISGSIRFDPDGAYGGDISLTTVGSWVKYSATFVASTYDWINFNFYGQSGVPAYYYLTNVQLEQKDHATEFVNGVRGATVDMGGGWKDLSGSANHGEFMNGLTYNNQYKSLFFNGINNYINCGNNQTLDLNNGGALCAWVKPDRDYPSDNSSQEYRVILAKEHGGGGGQQCYFMDWYGINSTRILRGCVGDNISSESVTVSYDFKQTWSLCIFTWNGSNSFLYVNGLLLNSIIQTKRVQITTDQLRIGYAFGSTWSGYLSNVWVYNQGLNPSEVLSLFNATKGRFGY